MSPLRLDREDPRRLVASSYDAIYDRYVEWGGGHAERRREAIDAVLADGLVSPGGTVLDLGCGTGQLATAYLVERGLRVTGVDISVSSVAAARRAVPGAQFMAADMAELELPGESLDLVTAFYSIIHLPRDLHAGLFAAISRWMRPGGVLVASLATRASENVAQDWLGAPMYWSSWDADTNERLVHQAGLEVIGADIETSLEDGIEVSFQWLTGRKPLAE
jgi:ubiquinone/menaquinone biosynthesis C-methylase UbiE